MFPGLTFKVRPNRPNITRVEEDWNHVEKGRFFFSFKHAKKEHQQNWLVYASFVFWHSVEVAFGERCNYVDSFRCFGITGVLKGTIASTLFFFKNVAELLLLLKSFTFVVLFLGCSQGPNPDKSIFSQKT